MGNSPPRRASAASSELERFTNPTGLYPSCPWDVRAARRLIVEKRIAPRFPGRDAKESCFTQECPICFMYYPGNLNTSTCCKKPICTECYLQLKPPMKSVCCPYCNREAFGVKYSAPAVLNLSSVYTESSYTSPSTPETSMSMSSPAAGAEDSTTSNSLHQHFASVEDRDRLRDDLRSQLNLTDQRITAPPSRPTLMHPAPHGLTNVIIATPEDAARLAEPRYIIASAEDAARLEEMMIMEAIRRSMRDLNVNDNDEDAGGEATVATTPSPTPAPPLARRPSTNPFDGVGSSTEPSRRRESSGWNPFEG